MDNRIRAIFEDINSIKLIQEKLPKLGTNPRGVEISANALKALVEHDYTIKIPILWKKEIINYNVYNKWIELWQQN